MANVLTILKLVPSEADLVQEDFVNNFIKPKCEEYGVELVKFDKEPLAFGMFALLIYLKNVDSEEGADKLNTLQEEFENMDSLQSIELQHQTLIDY